MIFIFAAVSYKISEFSCSQNHINYYSFWCSGNKSFKYSMTTQDITHYFKPVKPSTLRSSILQSSVDCVKRELRSMSHSQAGKKLGEYV